MVESRTILSEVESRTLGSRPRPRTQKNPRPRPRTALPRTDPLEAKDRNARGQGHRPRIQAQVFSKKRSSKNFFRRSQKQKKTDLQKIFSGSLQKKRLLKFFFRRPTKFQQFKKSTVLETRTGQFSRT